MDDFEWNPTTYLDEMLLEVPGYEALEDAVAAATAGLEARSVLELGIGTGETAVRILAVHPDARWTGIDASEPMLERARARLPHADLRPGRLEEPLPAGPFDLVVSVLAVHHLDGPAKRELFHRLAAVLPPGGHFVLGDVVVPEQAEDATIEIDWEYDVPSTVAEQLDWLTEAGFEAAAGYIRPDLAVLVAERQ